MEDEAVTFNWFRLGSRREEGGRISELKGQGTALVGIGSTAVSVIVPSSSNVGIILFRFHRTPKILKGPIKTKSKNNEIYYKARPWDVLRLTWAGVLLLWSFFCVNDGLNQSTLTHK